MSPTDSATSPALLILSILTQVTLLVSPVFADSPPPLQNSTFDVGWIGAMTGPAAKYGALEASQLAVEDVNAAGGIRGRELRLIREDAQCKGPLAVTALQKLAGLNRVTFILGGHCSPETLAIAPLVEAKGVMIFAAITTSPKLTGISKYALRISPESSIVGTILGKYAFDSGHRRVAIIQEETDYVLPAADKFAETFAASGGAIADVSSFSTGERDFRGIATKIRSLHVDGLYLGTQSKDSAVLVIRQLRQVGVRTPIFGNEQTGNSVIGEPQDAIQDFAGIVFAEPVFHPEQPSTAAFIARYKDRYKVSSLPLGIWTAEAYDSVRILTKALNECGESREAVRDCLIRTTDYPGVSGPVTITPEGNGSRKYVLKRISPLGQAEEIPPAK